jgi:hypothetical protein
MRLIDAGPIRHADIDRYDDSDIESALVGAGYDSADAKYRLIEVDVSEIEDTASFPLEWTPTTTMEALQRGEALPPVVVVRTDPKRGLGLIDGLNRAYAHWAVGPPTMRAYELLAGSQSRAPAESSGSRVSLSRLRWRPRVGRRAAIAVALLVVTGLAVGLAFALWPSSEYTLGPAGPHPLGGPAKAGNLRVSVPHGFSVYPLRGGIHRAGTRPPVIGHVLTNFRLPAGGSISKVLGQWSDPHGSGPPPNVVLVELAEHWPGQGLATDQLQLPLSLRQPWLRTHFANGTVGGFRVGSTRFDNFDYDVIYWSGPSARATDRLAVLRALRSIRPTS